jgi:hypothetical protein
VVRPFDRFVSGLNGLSGAGIEMAVRQIIKIYVAGGGCSSTFPPMSRAKNAVRSFARRSQGFRERSGRVGMSDWLILPGDAWRRANRGLFVLIIFIMGCFSKPWPKMSDRAERAYSALPGDECDVQN